MNENKFDGKSDVYKKFRPHYPLSFIEYLYGELGMTEADVIADIGSGTGILTKQLLDRGNKVFGVEPNADMRRAAETDLSGYADFISISASAEATTLENNSVDMITVGQAFHWFDKAKFKAECKRILKPDGKVVLVWNNRDEDCDIVIANKAINKKYCPNFNGFSGGIYDKNYMPVFNEFFDGVFETRRFDNPQYYDENMFLGRNLSSSYALKRDDKNFEPYIAELRSLFDKHSKNGKITVPHFTQSYTGTVRS